MKLTIEPTATVDTVDKTIPARIWEGITEALAFAAARRRSSHQPKGRAA